MNMSCDSTSLKKSSGECLKLAKQRYSILSEMMLFMNYTVSQKKTSPTFLAVTRESTVGYS